MTELLSKFRIQYSDVVMIPDVQKTPSPESLKAFDSLVSQFRDTSPANENQQNIHKEGKTYMYCILFEF